MNNLLNEGITIDPTTGKKYRVTPPKGRSAAFAALEAALVAAKDAQASYMRGNELAYDATRRITVSIETGEVPTNGAIVAEMQRLLAATRAAQQAIKAYKLAHPGEFTVQIGGRQGIPVVNAPRSGGRNAGFRGRGRAPAGW